MCTKDRSHLKHSVHIHPPHVRHGEEAQSPVVVQCVCNRWGKGLQELTPTDEKLVEIHSESLLSGMVTKECSDVQEAANFIPSFQMKMNNKQDK